MHLDGAQLVGMVLNGLVIAANLFIVSSGMSIVYGVSRISNFAHGSFYMLGAFMAYSIVQAMPHGAAWFFLAMALAALVVGVIGVLVEISVFRRIYNAPHHLQLIATFGLFLIVRDVALVIWGPHELFGPRVPGLARAVRILGRPFPEYNFVILGGSVGLLAALWLLFHKTRWGTLLRAATADREMVAALGVDQRWLFTTVFLLGSVLAGLGGALQIPRQPANLGMDIGIIIDVFAVVVIGGMGSITGTFLASAMIGLLQALGTIVYSEGTLALTYIVMALVLVARPQGLLGKHEGPSWHDPVIAASVLRPAGRRSRLIWAAFGLCLFTLPALIGQFALATVSESLIYALFAFSFFLMAGPAGMISFGQAAFFALGLYTAAVLIHFLAIGMIPALLLGPLVAGLGALVFGWFYARMEGIRLAMLSLAFGQIVWAIAYQWYWLTNGDNGILGVWPPAWLTPPRFYYLALILCGGSILLMRRVIFSPFGYSLRAGRDSSLRAEATGIEVARQRWAGFLLSGLFAGLAGVLMAYLKGSAFPSYADIGTSFDALVMALLGGLQALDGPLYGAVIYRLLKTYLQVEFDRWQIGMGLALILLVVFMPRGLNGLLDTWQARRARSRLPAMPRDGRLARRLLAAVQPKR